MLNYSDIKPRKFIVFGDEPYEVLDSHVFRKQQRKPVNQTKLKNLITGKVIENSFHQSDSVEEADIDKRSIKYLYINKQKGEYWFCEKDDPSQRFNLPPEVVAEKIKYIKEGDIVDFLTFGDTPIGLDIPIKVNLKVVSAPPSIKGNTAQGGNKQVEVETGATVTTPMFIEEGDVIEVNTETGQYSNRVS